MHSTQKINARDQSNMIQNYEESQTEFLATGRHNNGSDTSQENQSQGTIKSKQAAVSEYQNYKKGNFASTLRQEIHNLLQQAQIQQEISQNDISHLHQQSNEVSKYGVAQSQGSQPDRKKPVFSFPDEDSQGGKLGCLLMMKKVPNIGQFQSAGTVVLNKFTTNQTKEGSIMASTAPQSNHAQGNQRYNQKNDFFLILDEAAQEDSGNNDFHFQVEKDERISQISDLTCDPMMMKDLNNHTYLTNDIEGSSIIEIIQRPELLQQRESNLPEFNQKLQLQINNQLLNETTATAMSILLDYGGNQTVRAQKVYQTRELKGLNQSKSIAQIKPIKDQNMIILTQRSPQLQPLGYSEQASCDMTNLTIMNSPVANLGQKLHYFQRNNDTRAMKQLNTQR
ncbi:UNKNOWN [Stylonychia lemnae]|uniref:Uncharacterized protein n=1 Tax=Stylonychia lemnae TaxID=5949 RepID=A0A078A277_STYLE|nr:UNKNOWN [Stylonychia lemnae]|eukprot:CDW74864.1 UNKNOWN [Stylonychia lemnae]